MTKEKRSSGAAGGIGIGNVLAILLSWKINQSIGWAILHGFCGWLYVLYYLIAY